MAARTWPEALMQKVFGIYSPEQSEAKAYAEAIRDGTNGSAEYSAPQPEGSYWYGQINRSGPPPTAKQHDTPTDEREAERANWTKKREETPPGKLSTLPPKPHGLNTGKYLDQRSPW